MKLSDKFGLTAIKAVEILSKGILKTPQARAGGLNNV